MNTVDRVRNILLTPKAEWKVIAREEPEALKILTGYVIPLVLLGAFAAFIGYGYWGDTFFKTQRADILKGLYYALNRVVVTIATIYITSLVLNELAPAFDSQKHFGKSFQLVAYSATPALVAVLFSLIPALQGIARFFGAVYAIYICYTGLPVLKKTPGHKTLTYIIAAFVTLIVVYAVLGGLFAAIMYPFFGL
jgi:hypothetical protein